MNVTFIFISLFICSSTIIFPQLQQGSFLAGGGFSGKIETVDRSRGGNYFNYEADMVEFNFFPNTAYFVLENIAVGLTARIGIIDSKLDNYRNDEITSESSVFTFTYGIGPFFRYYTPFGDFAFFFGFKYEWLWDDTEWEYEYFGELTLNSISEADRNRSMFSPALGVSYFFNRYVSIESMLRYEIENIEYSSNEPNSNNDIESETNYNRFLIVVGLQIYFPVE